MSNYNNSLINSALVLCPSIRRCA